MAGHWSGVSKGVGLLVAAIIAGRWIIPVVIRQVALTESSELFLLTLIALCLGVALITANLGLSIEIGAFVAGLMIAEIDYADQALAKVLPLRDTFASLFFCFDWHVDRSHSAGGELWRNCRHCESGNGGQGAAGATDCDGVWLFAKDGCFYQLWSKPNW